jgi:predicted HAD superfamily phosphohydrolase
VICTAFPLDRLHQEIKRQELVLLTEAERYILNKLYDEQLVMGRKDKLIKAYLDDFYWTELARTTVGVPNKCIQVIGGRRKVWAMERVAQKHNIYLEHIVFVGDSITDAQGARVVEATGGLSIAFNGNAFVVPYATVGVGSMCLLDVEPIMDAWSEGGREKVKALVETMPPPNVESGPFYDWLVGKKGTALKRILDAHRKTRSLVRAEAAKLG